MTTESTEDQAEAAKPIGLRYTGGSHRRVLSPSDIESLGATPPKKDLVWDASNDKFLPASAMSKTALEAIADKVNDFVIEY